MKNTVITEAVAAKNAALAEQTTNAALDLIDQIQSTTRAKTECQERVTRLRNELGLVVKDEVTEASILGGSLPQNSNRETIAKIVEAANKARQFTVESKSKRIVDGITAEQDAIKSLDDKLAELRKKLTDLQFPEVTQSQITG